MSRLATFPRSTTSLLLVGIFVLGLILRIVTLDAHGFWGDEINSLDGASLGLPGIITGRFGYLSNQTPLHYLIVWLTSQVADPASTSLIVRLPSALVGSLSILVVYALGKEMFGKPQGLIAAALLAFSPTALNFSQDLRLYSMMLFLSSLAAYCLLRADLTGGAGWWAAFAAAEVANVSNAYVALTLSSIPMLIALGWVLWKRWRTRQDNPSDLRYGALAAGVVLLGMVFNGLDLLGGPRMPPDLGKFSFVASLTSIPELLTWFTPFGLGGQLERLLGLGIFLLFLVGVVAALAHPRRSERRYESVGFSLLFIVIPAIMLSVFATTSVVFQRYALFVLPFYLLLVSHGLASLYYVDRSSPMSTRLLPLRVPALALGVIVFGAFGLGAFLYLNPATHINMAYRPDFRGAARYLLDKATPADTIIFLDDPGLGYTITNFYWRSNPPAAVFDARDPRLFAHAPTGDIYWVVSMENLALLDQLSAPDMGWSDRASFERVLVLREANPTGMVGSMEHIVSKLEAIWPGGQPVLTLRGSILQARGELEDAAAAYRRAGTYFPVGDDYLRAAMGYDALGRDVFAWREAFISKFWQPFRPQVHEWLASKLQAANLPEQSRAETELVRLLASSR